MGVFEVGFSGFRVGWVAHWFVGSFPGDFGGSSISFEGFF